MIVKGFLVPGMPQIYLAPEKNKGWQNLRNQFDLVKDEIAQTDADLIVIYSTYWPSIIGHQVQADPKPKWNLVDDDFHELGTINYEFKVDTQFATDWVEACQKRGLHSRKVNYQGFPVDTGSVVAMKLLNPDNRLPISILSSNIYADRSETLVLGKATRDAIEKSNRKAIVIAVSALSNRLFDKWIDPGADHFHSLKDQEWNKKYLEFLEAGRLEDVSQLSRQFHKEARVPKVSNFKPFWWLASTMGQHNRYKGQVYAYEPVYGTGAALVGLTPHDRAARDLEFDESDPDQYLGERNVLATSGPSNELSDGASN